LKSIFDNIIFELQNAGGISLYWFELLSRIQSQSDNTILFGYENSNIFCSDLNLTNLKSEIYSVSFRRRYFPFQPANKSLLKEKHVFHSSYFRYSNHPQSINITTVHDFTYEHFVRGPRLWVHSWQKKLAVKKSQGIICVSDNTKKDLLYFYPWIDSCSVKVIHNGVSDAFFPVENPYPALFKNLGFSPESPYLLFVGDRSIYKNFDAFISLAEYFSDFDLIVVGGKQFTEEEALKIAPLGRRFQHFRDVSSSVLNHLYNAAHCLIYPTYNEGFGIPNLQAMKAG
jgi:mannosyltransferase